MNERLMGIWYDFALLKISQSTYANKMRADECKFLLEKSYKGLRNLSLPMRTFELLGYQSLSPDFRELLLGDCWDIHCLVPLTRELSPEVGEEKCKWHFRTCTDQGTTTENSKQPRVDSNG